MKNYKTAKLQKQWPAHNDMSHRPACSPASVEESLQQLDLQCHAFDEEQEQIQTFYAIEKSRKESEAVVRPPASPLTSKTPIPCVEKPIAKAPAICS